MTTNNYICRVIIKDTFEELESFSLVLAEEALAAHTILSKVKH